MGLSEYYECVFLRERDCSIVLILPFFIMITRIIYICICLSRKWPGSTSRKRYALGAVHHELRRHGIPLKAEKEFEDGDCIERRERVWAIEQKVRCVSVS